MNRAAEAAAIFAVVCAGMFGHPHRPRLGRLLAVPAAEPDGRWPFRSPLLWDVFAVSTYASVSLLFWYMGMVPGSTPSGTAR